MTDAGPVRAGAAADGDRPSTADGERGSCDADGATSSPARTSAAVALLVTLVAVGALATRVAPGLAVAVAAVHAATFTASLWLVGRERWGTVATAVAGALSLVVGATFAVAVGYTALALVATLYPVENVAQIRPHGLRVASATLVVLGGTVAMVGGLATAVGCLRPGRAWTYAKLAVETFVVPLAVAALMLLSTLLGRLGGADEAPVVAPLLDAVGAGVDALLSPVPGRAHVFTFCVLLAVTALAVARGLDALPVSELTTARTHDGAERAAAVAGSVARWTAIGAALALPVGFLEVFVPPERLAAVLTAPVYGLLAALTGSPLLRVSLAGVAVVAGVVGVLRRSARASPRDVGAALAPVLGGGLVVALAAATHDAVLPPTLAFVAEALPGQFATAFSRQSAAIVDFYGSLAVVVTVAATFVGTAAVLALALALVSAVDALPDRAPAPALAAAGTFAAAGFAVGADVAAPLVLGGIVAALVVWDAGEFGAVLGREVGRDGATAVPELVHLAATLAVGTAAALAAAAVDRFAPAAPPTEVTTVPFAFAVVLAAFVLLVAALR